MQVKFCIYPCPYHRASGLANSINFIKNYYVQTTVSSNLEKITNKYLITAWYITFLMIVKRQSIKSELKQAVLTNIFST